MGGFYWVSVQAASSSGTGGGQEPDDDGGDWIKILDFGKEDQQGEVVDEESYYPGSEDWKDGSKKNLNQLKIIKEEVKGEEKEGEYEYEAELFVGGEKKGNDGKKIKIKIKESKDDGPPVVQNDNELASSPSLFSLLSSLFSLLSSLFFLVSSAFSLLFSLFSLFSFISSLLYFLSFLFPHLSSPCSHFSSLFSFISSLFIL